jgi:hypothetical protein
VENAADRSAYDEPVLALRRFCDDDDLADRHYERGYSAGPVLGSAAACRGWAEDYGRRSFLSVVEERVKETCSRRRPEAGGFGGRWAGSRGDVVLLMISASSRKMR